LSSIFARSILVIFIVFSFIFSQSIHPSFGADGTSSTCADTNITGLSASASNQIFIPKNVIDNNFNTLWSNYGKGSWIQLDLGTSKNICSVNVAWYKGDTRQNNFVISTSTDGSSFKNVLATKSIGNTLSYEKYSIPNTLARYVKITVNGNTQNNYASITEVRIQTTTSLNQPQQTQCSIASIKGLQRSASQTGFPSSNILDNNLNTRWSNNGKGSWIQLDLGTSKNICSVNIAWYKGNERQNNFVISTSKDGSTFTKVLEKKSSGTTTNLEKYVLSNINARYVKITVNGNTQNDYASITEVKVSVQNTSPPTPPSTGDGGGTGTPPSTGGGGGTGDGNSGGDGVKMIYPTVSGGETWFFNPTNPDDGQFDRNGAEISKNTDSSWHLKPGTTRMLAFTKSSGFPSDEVRSSLPTYDYSRLAQIGYFYKPTDWKNVEITIYVKVLSTAGGGDEISLVSRSVRHSTNVHEGCGGSSYHNNIDFTNGKFKFKKEMWHVNYDIKPYSGITIGSTMNKWIGFKGIVYNLPDGSVKLESYVDKDNNNNWQKATELVDKGNWGNDMTHCNARTGGAAVTWGSPMIIFKSNGVTYDFKKFSVRQIVPPV
jgi:F5/8 type C domain